MNNIDRLRKGMEAASASPPPHWEASTLKTLQEGLSHLQRWIKAGTGNSAPPKDAVADAIRAFYARQEFAKLRDARYVCFGFADPVGHDNYRLIEDAQRFPRFLTCIDQYRATPRPYRRCYRGLLSGYFSYDPEGDTSVSAGKKNWHLLRTYLSERQGQIRVSGAADPEWVDSIARNRDLLSERACGDLGRQALEGDASAFELVCKELEVGDQTWVVRNFVRAQLDAAAAKSDRLYRELLPRLQQLLHDHELHLDEGLARLLERYRNCTSAELNVGLRDFAVHHWGNPWLKLNDKKWGRVSEATRQMVTGWLKLKWMRDFFRLLAEDGSNDRRRLEFWLRYIDQITDMYFVLGTDAMQNSDADFKQLRNEMTGRLLHLYAAGAPSNNAFLMRIGEHMVVEFGAKGNACFVFDSRRELPFKLQGYVAGNTSELKHEKRVARLLHIDRKDESWEQHFQRELRGLLNVTPAQTVGREGPATRLATPTAAARTASPRPPANTVLAHVFTRAEFDKLARSNSVATADNSRQGGALWVYVGQASSPVTRQLKAWGFKYAEGKGWWRKE